MNELARAVAKLHLALPERPGVAYIPPAEPPQSSRESSQRAKAKPSEREETEQDPELWCGSQEVRHRFAKPTYVGSNPIRTSISC
jgi:hypothetical protein